MNYSYRVDFEIHHLPKLPNQLLGAPWFMRKNHAKEWKSIIAREVVLKLNRWVIDQSTFPLEHANLILTRYSSKSPDYDGLVGSFKSVIDALKFHKVILDDTPAVIGRPDYRWEKTSPRHGKIKIQIEWCEI